MYSGRFIAALAALLSIAASAAGQDGRIQLYGFVRTYAAYDSRESFSSLDELLYYVPRDVEMVGGRDLNAVGSLRVAALTSRLGVDVTDYGFGGWDMGAKLEADFGAGITGVTGTALMRLRQAYVTFAYDDLSFKAGQAWHPVSEGHPDLIALNAGAPYNPLSRTLADAVHLRRPGYGQRRKRRRFLGRLYQIRQDSRVLSGSLLFR